MKLVATSIVIVAIATVSPQGSTQRPGSLAECVVTTDVNRQVECYRDLLMRQLPDGRDLELLASRISGHPSSSERLLDVALDACDACDPRTRAAILDLAGRALFARGRYTEAANEYDRCLKLDPGVATLSWYSVAGTPVWSSDLDGGDGVFLRAARANARAGRAERAHELFDRAFALDPDDGTEDVGRDTDGAPADHRRKPAAPLDAVDWRERLPELAVDLVDGGRFELTAARGKIVLLDFWASWCSPCIHELPHLQTLYEAEREHGLVALAINADEPAPVAREAAAALGLTMPVGTLGGDLEARVDIDSLPTLILLDGDGRIRYRWDGYRPGLESEVADRARALLRGADVLGSRTVAEIMLGDGELEIRWSREAPSSHEGCAVVRLPSGDVRVVATVAGSLTAFNPGGKVMGQIRATGGIGRLLHGDVTGDGVADLVGYRPGASRIGIVDMKSRSSVDWQAPAPLREIRLSPADVDPGGPILATTPVGTWFLGADGREVSRVGGGARSAMVARQQRDVELLILADNGSLRWIAPEDGSILRERSLATGGRVLVSADDSPGFGVSSGDIVSWVAGHFIGDDHEQIAIATADGRLSILDLDTGRARFRAAWPSIVQLAAGDLDGGGGDELVVAAGTDLAVLGAPTGTSSRVPK